MLKIFKQKTLRFLVVILPLIVIAFISRYEKTLSKSQYEGKIVYPLIDDIYVFDLSTFTKKKIYTIQRITPDGLKRVLWNPEWVDDGKKISFTVEEYTNDMDEEDRKYKHYVINSVNDKNLREVDFGECHFKTYLEGTNQYLCRKENRKSKKEDYFVKDFNGKAKKIEKKIPDEGISSPDLRYSAIRLYKAMADGIDIANIDTGKRKIIYRENATQDRYLSHASPSWNKKGNKIAFIEKYIPLSEKRVLEPPPGVKIGEKPKKIIVGKRIMRDATLIVYDAEKDKKQTIAIKPNATDMLDDFANIYWSPNDKNIITVQSGRKGQYLYKCDLEKGTSKMVYEGADWNIVFIDDENIAFIEGDDDKMDKHIARYGYDNIEGDKDAKSDKDAFTKLVILNTETGEKTVLTPATRISEYSYYSEK